MTMPEPGNGLPGLPATDIIEDHMPETFHTAVSCALLFTAATAFTAAGEDLDAGI